MGLRGPQPRPIAERYWEKVEIGDPDECWRWLASTRPDGRPQFYVGRPRIMEEAFRVGYRLAFGDYPRGLDLDHLCNHSWCVNPNHMWPSTPKENRGRPEREKTHCSRGHAYDVVNTYRHRHSGKRTCRACAAAFQRRRRARMKEEDECLV